MLKLDFFTTALVSITFGFQAFVTDYYIFLNYEVVSYILAGVDTLIALYILASFPPQYATSRGGIIWLIYNWIFLAKLTLFYWFIFPISSVSLSQTIIFEYIHIENVLYLSPVIFSILSFRSICFLYGSSSLVVSLEALSVRILNMPHIFDMSFKLLRYSNGVFLMLGVFMHSYSFPSTPTIITPSSDSSTAKSSSKTKLDIMQTISDSDQLRSQRDIFLTRKHAALVALFLIDLPQLILRITLWIQFPDHFNDKPMIIKNILFIPVQAFRLNQCRLAERNSTGRTKKKPLVNQHPFWDKASSYLLTTSNKHNNFNNNNNKNNNDQDILNVHDGLLENVTSNVQECYFKPTKKKSGAISDNVEKLLSRHDYSYHPGSIMLPRQSKLHRRQLSSAFNEKDQSSSQKNTRLGHSAQSSASHSFTNIASDFTDNIKDCLSQEVDVNADFTFKGSLNKKKTEPLTVNQLYRLVQDVNTTRRIPVAGFSFWIVLKKMFHCIKLGSRRGVANLLDETLVLNYWNEIRLTLPLLTAWCTQILLVTVLIFFNGSALWKPDDTLLFLFLITWTWKNLPIEYRLFVYLAGVSSSLIFLSWFLCAPFLDVVFLTILWIVQFTTFFLTLIVLRDTNFFELNELWNLSISTQPILLHFLYVPPCVRLLNALFPIQSAFLGRKYIYLLRAFRDNKLQNLLVNTFLDFSDAETEQLKSLLSEEGEYISTSSLLVFLNCRHALAPISINELLIGSNIIKNIRLMDILLTRCWTETFTVFIIHCFVLTRTSEMVYLIIFAVYFVLFSIYHIFSQTVRLLSLRRFEIKLSFEAMLRNLDKFSMQKGENQIDFHYDNHHHHHRFNGISSSNHSYDTTTHPFCLPPRRFLISTLSIIERYQQQGFFTAPGEVFLSFL